MGYVEIHNGSFQHHILINTFFMLQKPTGSDNLDFLQNFFRKTKRSNKIEMR